MSTKFNSASRLLSVFSEIKNMPSDTSYINTFANIFELDRTLPYYEKEALNLSFLCLYELDVLGKYAHEVLKYPKETFEDKLLSLKSAIHINHINYSVGQFNHYITDIALHNLQMFIYQIPDEGSEEYIQSIKQSISNLEKMLAQEAYPEAWKIFIREQINTFKLALKKYQINGVLALQEAEIVVTGNIFTKIQLIFEFYQHPSFKELKSILILIKKLINTGATIAGYIDAANTLGITFLIEKAIEQLPKS